MRHVGTIVQLLPLALGALLLFWLNIPPINQTRPGLRFDNPLLLSYSIALGAAVLVGRRGPRWGIVPAFLAGLAITFALGVAPDTVPMYTPAFRWWIVGAAVVSVVGWTIRILALAQERADRADP